MNDGDGAAGVGGQPAAGGNDGAARAGEGDADERAVPAGRGGNDREVRTDGGDPEAGGADGAGGGGGPGAPPGGPGGGSGDAELVAMVHEFIKDYILAVDRKASILLTGLFALLGLTLNVLSPREPSLFSRSTVDLAPLLAELLRSPGLWLLGLSATMGAYALVFSGWVVYPRRTPPSHGEPFSGPSETGFIYWGRIVNFVDREMFVGAVGLVDDDQAFVEVAKNVYNIADIAAVKYSWLRRSMGATFLMFVLAAAGLTVRMVAGLASLAVILTLLVLGLVVLPVYLVRRRMHQGQLMVSMAPGESGLAVAATSDGPVAATVVEQDGAGSFPVVSFEGLAATQQVRLQNADGPRFPFVHALAAILWFERIDTEPVATFAADRNGDLDLLVVPPWWPAAGEFGPEDVAVTEADDGVVVRVDTGGTDEPVQFVDLGGMGHSIYRA